MQGKTTRNIDHFIGAICGNLQRLSSWHERETMEENDMWEKRHAPSI